MPRKNKWPVQGEFAEVLKDNEYAEVIREEADNHDVVFMVKDDI
ncbi:MAG: hypothetical protein QGH39_12260 [Candidatus Thermoplasmatota archaeon]|jgi:hypothetical protein|nr:hypothetical protein [Candidatus Thermoplasmatota archaeon]MDP7266319.1 hypothetical protein [Candidatus Thermoplasmatota archaeon]